MSDFEHNWFIGVVMQDFPNFSITRSDLERPTQAFVFKYFSMIVESVTRLPKLLHFTAAQNEFLQLSCEGPYITKQMRILNLYKSVKNILERLTDINIEIRSSDFLVPHLTPARNFIIMNAIYEFYSSCAVFDGHFEEVMKSETRSDHMVKLKEQNNALKSQLEQKQRGIIVNRERVAVINQKLGDRASENEEVQNYLKDLHCQEEIEKKNLHHLEELEQKEQEVLKKVDTEKQYYETLVVSDETQMLEDHNKLDERKAKCAIKLQELAKQSKENQTKLSIFDQVIALQTALNKELIDEASIGNKNYNLRNLHELAGAIRKECEALSKEENKLVLPLQETKHSLSEMKEVLSRLQSDKDSVTCQWTQRLEKYEQLRQDLTSSLAVWNNRVDLTDGAIEAAREELEKLNKVSAVTTSVLKLKHANFSKDRAELENALLAELADLHARALAYNSNK